MNTETRKCLQDVIRMFESVFYRQRSLQEDKNTPWWYVRASMKASKDDWLSKEEYDWRNKLEDYINEKGFAVGDGHGQGSNGDIDVWWWTQHLDELLNEVSAFVEREKRGMTVSFNTLLTAPRSEGPPGALPDAYRKRHPQ